jgi:hypothetical protein
MHRSVRTDKEGRLCREPAQKHRHSERICDLAIWITEKWKREVKVFFEPSMIFD